jgi:hypothetical protein
MQRGYQSPSTQRFLMLYGRITWLHVSAIKCDIFRTLQDIKLELQLQIIFVWLVWDLSLGGYNTHVYITYLFTPRNGVLLEKLTSSQVVKKFPAFYGIGGSDQFRSCPHPTSWRSILILSSHLSFGLQNQLFSSDFPPKIYMHFSFPHTSYTSSPSHFSRFDRPNYIWWEVKIIMFLMM